MIDYFVDFQETAQRLREKMLEKQCEVSLFYEEEAVAAEKLHGYFERAEELAWRLFYLPPGSVVSAGQLRLRVKIQKEPNREETEAHLKAMSEIPRAFARYDAVRDQGALRLFLESYFSGLRNAPRSRKLVMEEMELFGEKAWNLDLWEQAAAEDIPKRLRLPERKEQDRSEYVESYVRRYVETHYAQVINVDEMACGVRLSPNYMRSLFKERTGMTVNEWITDFRMQKACELLRDRRLRIKEVGRMVGYENSSYFCAVFYRYFGMSPNEYRMK